VTTILQKPLFSWEDVDGSSDLRRLQLVLEYLPDESVVAGLERERGARGRNTYPVRPVWNAVLAGVVLQHPTVESLLRDLRRNAELRQVCGFNPLLGSAAVPSSFAMSRFLANLVEHADLVNDMFDELVDQLRALLPDLGQHLGFDGKAIPSFSTDFRGRITVILGGVWCRAGSQRNWRLRGAPPRPGSCIGRLPQGTPLRMGLWARRG
jgi:hypothetical protein